MEKAFREGGCEVSMEKAHAEVLRRMCYEDEFHFLVSYMAYTDLRQIYVNPLPHNAAF